MDLQERFNDFYLCYFEGDHIPVSARQKLHDMKIHLSKMYYVTDGECEFIIDGNHYIAKSGDLFYIPPNTLHSLHILKEPYTNYYFHFYLEINKQPLDDLFAVPYYAHIGDNSEFLEICESLLFSARRKSIGAALMLKSHLLRLITFYLSLHRTPLLPEAAPGRARHKREDALAIVTDYIQKHPERKITLAELAELVHLHPNYLCRLFKKTYGISPMKYVFQIKMDYCRYLVIYTQIPIKTIAYMVGYNDLAHFSKDFKTLEYGSPRQLRATIRRRWSDTNG